jgi:FHS family glucose/mannose:H+ symporter-like MFS transporter
MSAPGQTSVVNPATRFTLPNTILHAGFVVTGVATTFLGPLLPGLSSRWSLSDAQAGLFFTAQFLGSIIGVTLSSVLLPSRGFRLSIATGYVATGAGIGVLGLGSWTAGLLASLVFGFGLGLITPGTNLFIAESSSARPAAALTLLNLAWCLGAAVCPPLAGLALRGNRLESFLLVVAVFCGLAGVAAASVLPPHSRELAQSFAQIPPGETQAWTKGFLAALGALFFLYIGTENSLAGWAASFVKRLSTTSELAWAMTPTYFWASLAAGRAVAPVMLRHFSEKAYALGGLTVAAVGAAAMLRAASAMGVTLSVVAAGLGLAAVFPILVAWLWESQGPAAKRKGGVLFALGGLGGATLPWLVGLASTQRGSLREGLIVPMLGIVTMMILVWRAMPGSATGASRKGERS